MTDFNPQGPSPAQWAALVVLAVVALCLCSAVGYAARPLADKAGEITGEALNVAGENINAVRNSDPIFGPIEADAIVFSAIGVPIALIGAAIFGYAKLMKGER